MSSTTTKTINDAIAEARLMVNDVLPPYRNDDPVYLAYLNSGLRALYQVRPDAFIGNFTQGIISTTAVVTYDITDLVTVPLTPFPVDDRQFFNPLVAYMAGRIEIADDEYTETSRSQQLLLSFRQQLMGA